MNGGMKYTMVSANCLEDIQIHHTTIMVMHCMTYTQRRSGKLCGVNMIVHCLFEQFDTLAQKYKDTEFSAYVSDLYVAYSDALNQRWKVKGVKDE